MKGFIPVTKAALLEMTANCRKIVVNDLATNKAARIDRYVSMEKERISVRRWYRLFILPVARFNFDEASVITYSNNRNYELFEGCPFKSLECDAENSLQWIARIERIAECEYAGEPIQIDMKTFLRLSEPDRYYWATCGAFYSVR